MKTDLILILDYLGTFVFAVSGIRMAAKKNLDIFGLFVIGLITAVGGGTLRDLLINSHPIFWMVRVEYIAIVALALLFTIMLRHKIVVFNSTFYLFDTLGIGLFTVIGLEKSLSMGYGTVPSIMMGVISSIAGGLTRDVLLNEIPLILHKEIYATACFTGAVLYVTLNYWGIDEQIIQLSCFIVIVAIRLLAIKYNISFPSISRIG